MAGTSGLPIPDCRDLAPIGERLASTLYSAQSDRLGRGVTVTVFPPLSDDAARHRFDHAAATAQRLAAHPNVLVVHDWGHGDDGRPWVVTDPQPAETLDTALKTSGPFPVDRALRICVLVAGALETAHRAGIVHGDLSPARLVFGPQDEPLVADMGLAEFSNFPGFGALHDPIRYFAPPEVLERTGVTAASDIYALATTLYALLAGRAPHEKPPYITDSNASLLLRILQIEVPPIVRPDVPPGLERALHVALSHAPEKRPRRALDLAWSLQDIQRTAGLAVAEPVVLDLGDDDPQPMAPPAAAPADQPATPSAAPPWIAAPPLPPELDALPAWYTDPLPNEPAVLEAELVDLFSDTPPDFGDRSPNPAPHWASGLDHLAAPTAPPGEHDDHGAVTGDGEPAADTPRHWPAPSNGHRPNGRGPQPLAGAATDPPAAWGVERLQPPRPAGLNGTGPNGRQPAPHAGRDVDLGPVPPPRLPGRQGTEQAGRAGPVPDPPGARPRRASGSAGTGAFPVDGSTRLGSALDRARQTRDMSRLARSDGAASGSSLVAPERHEPREAPDRPEGAAPALPVIVLIVVVVLLTLGVAYMVVTDNGTTEPGAGQPGAAPPAAVSVPIHQA